MTSCILSNYIRLSIYLTEHGHYILIDDFMYSTILSEFKNSNVSKAYYSIIKLTFTFSLKKKDLLDWYSYIYLCLHHPQ